ncbi:MAG: aldo/keto reductase [Desulfobacteraceae bacterium]|nr:aldo/keto reductase [Desulfobacteraceae bacterium]
MELRSLGPTDIKISPIIMGTWQAGKAMWTGIDETEIKQALRQAYQAGITTFDTAEVYGNGYSERMIGEALSDVRPNIVLASKVFSNHLKHDQVIKACERSLKNLRTDYIDLYQIHWPPGSFGHAKVALEETMGALNELKKNGKIRAIGVSNFNCEQMQEAARFGDIVSLQPPYSLFWRHIEPQIRPHCLDRQMTIMAYSPMAQGLLTGKFGPGHQFEKGDHRTANRLFEHENYQRVQAALDRLRPIAEAKQISLGQLALAWVIAQPNTCAIAGARNAGQAEKNAAAAGVVLDKNELDRIDAIGRTVTDHLDDNPVMWKW